MGFIDHLSADTTATASTPDRTVARPSARDSHVSCSFRSRRSSRPQRFSPQQDLIRRPGPLAVRRFVAPCSQPWGSPRFRLPLDLAISRDPHQVISKSSSVATTLRSVPLSCSQLPRHRAVPFRKRPRSPRRCFPLAVARRRSCRVATTASSRARPQGLSPPESPLHPPYVAALRGSMLPWALDRFVRMPPRLSAPGGFPLRFTRGSAPFECPQPPESDEEGKSRLVWLRRRAATDPKIGARRCDPLTTRRPLRFRSARPTPGRVDRDSRLALPRPEGRSGPRQGTLPKKCPRGTGEEIPRGPFVAYRSVFTRR
jgi:hypothetical protein